MLDWHGYSEADSQPLELTYWHEEDTDEWVVWETWGCEVDKDYFTEEVARYATEEEAKAHVKKHNAEAFESACDIEWTELPIPVTDVSLFLRNGTFPQNRIAEIEVTVPWDYAWWHDEADEDDPDARNFFEVRGSGDVKFMRDTWSPDSTESAISRVVERLKEIARPYAGYEFGEVLDFKYDDSLAQDTPFYHLCHIRWSEVDEPGRIGFQDDDGFTVNEDKAFEWLERHGLTRIINDTLPSGKHWYNDFCSYADARTAEWN
jgi:hypothetical protein